MSILHPRIKFAVLFALSFLCLISFISIRSRFASAEESSVTAEQVAQAWRHPDAGPKVYRVTGDRHRIAGDMFFVDKPFGEVWEYYAKKCGQQRPYNDSSSVSVIAGLGYTIQNLNGFARGETGLTTQFTYQNVQNVVSVTLNRESDKVQVFVSAVTK